MSRPPITDATGYERCLDDIAKPTLLVRAETPCETVEQLFVDHPHLSSVVVLHPDGDLEMLTRRRWTLEFTGRIGYGRALYARRPVAQLPGGEHSLILNGSTSLLESGRAALARHNRYRYDDIVVPSPHGAAMVSVASLFSELALLHAHRSLHDPLTGLANRELFIDRLRAAVAAPGTTAAVLFVDLDDFKSVNDSLGHPSGDELLQLVGARLRGAFREEDTVARFGGDEFAVLLFRASEGSAIAAAGRIALALAAPAVIGGRSVTVRASVGVALESEDRAAEALLRDADLAMYAAKHDGKDGHAVFAPGLHAAAVDRLDLVQDLGRALEGDELRLEYQPVVDLFTGRVTGAEALLRWTHPARGPVAPLDFIGLAEQSGAIIPIGRWVLDEALRQVAAWGDRLRPESEPLVIGVNVSPRQLELPGFAREVRDALRRRGVDPSQLVLEVTESALIHDDETTRAELTELSELGVKIAIDDFGTGFSSLHRLQRLPTDVLKIDKAFTHELDAAGGAGLLRGLLGLADALGIEALAEGIESERQLTALVAAGCQFGQGFHLARPLHPDAVGALLAEGTAAHR